MADAHGGRTELLDHAAGLVDRTTHISSFRDLNHVHLNERARINGHDCTIDFGGDAEVTARVRQVRQDDLRAIERQTSAGGVGAEFSLRHVRRQADWGNGFDQLAGFHGVAIGATNVQDGDAGEGRVGVEGDLTLAERTGGSTTTDGQLRGARSTTHVDPDVAQGVGADVVRSAEDNRGRVAAATDDEAVGRVGRSDRAVKVSGCTPSHDLGVTIEGHRAGKDFVAREAEGTDAALSGRRVAGEVQAERRRAAVGL